MQVACRVFNRDQSASRFICVLHRGDLIYNSIWFYHTVKTKLLYLRGGSTMQSDHCLSLASHCRFFGLSLPFLWPFTAVSLTLRCLSLASHCLSLALRCLSLAFHCRSSASHCISLAFRCLFFGLSLPFFGLSLPFVGLSLPFFGLSLPFFGLSRPFFGLSLPFFGLSLPFLWPLAAFSLAFRCRSSASRCRSSAFAAFHRPFLDTCTAFHTTQVKKRAFEMLRIENFDLQQVRQNRLFLSRVG